MALRKDEFHRLVPNNWSSDSWELYCTVKRLSDAHPNDPTYGVYGIVIPYEPCMQMEWPKNEKVYPFIDGIGIDPPVNEKGKVLGSVFTEGLRYLFKSNRQFVISYLSLPIFLYKIGLLDDETLQKVLDYLSKHKIVITKADSRQVNLVGTEWFIEIC